MLKILITSLLLGLCGFSLAQNKTSQYQWLGSSSDILVKEMNMSYQKPKTFVENTDKISLKYSPKLELIYGASKYQKLVSEDKEVVVFININPVYTQEFANEMNALFASQDHNIVDRQHHFQTIFTLKTYLGKQAAKNWKHYVKYYSQENAKKIFNADTAFTYTLNLNKEDILQDKYRYATSLILQRKGKGYITLEVFYTEKAKKNLNKYWRRIEKAFWYNDKP